MTHNNLSTLGMMASVASMRRSFIVARRWITFGIRREEKSAWESRAPLSPGQVEGLLKQLGAKFIVQPSNTRVFTDLEYQKVLLLRIFHTNLFILGRCRDYGRYFSL